MRTLATKTFIRKVFQSIFFVVCISIFIAVMAFSFDSCKSNGIFFSKTLIFTFFTAICSVFCLCWKMIGDLSAIFACYRNFFRLIPLVKTSVRAKNPGICARTCFKSRFTKFTGDIIFFISRLLTARNATKNLSFLKSFKCFLTRFTDFIHSQRIYHLFINEQVKA